MAQKSKREQAAQANKEAAAKLIGVKKTSLQKVNPYKMKKKTVKSMEKNTSYMKKVAKARDKAFPTYTSGMAGGKPINFASPKTRRGVIRSID